jgi:hypothetical protein
MPPGILRSVEAGDAAVVHVDAVRQPDQDQNLIASAIGSLAECRRGIICRCVTDRCGTKFPQPRDQANLNYPTR